MRRGSEVAIVLEAAVEDEEPGEGTDVVSEGVDDPEDSKKLSKAWTVFG